MTFEQRIDAFLAACKQDAALREFARKRPLSLRFHITDHDLEFILVFKEGTVQAEKSSSGRRADLNVQTDVETFDGVMSGRVNGATAYMTGKLRFSGDTMKGMAVQKITKEMVRLWKAAENAQ